MNDHVPDIGLNMKKVLHGTDFLESSRLALDYAVGFAMRFHATLTIVHSFEPTHEAVEAEYRIHQPSVSRADASMRLERLASGVSRLGVNVSSELREGQPATTLVQAASDMQAQLMVLGTHGIYRGLEHLLIGSNAEKLLLSSPCPTLTIGRHVLAGVDTELGFRDVFLATDLKPDSLAAASYAFELAADFGVPVNLFIVTTADRQRAEHEAEAFLSGLRQNSSRATLSPYRIESVDDAQEAIRRAEASPDSLVVTGVCPVGRLDRHLHSSFAFELAARSSSPVLSVPPSLGATIH